MALPPALLTPTPRRRRRRRRRRRTRTTTPTPPRTTTPALLMTATQGSQRRRRIRCWRRRAVVLTLGLLGCAVGAAAVRARRRRTRSPPPNALTIDTQRESLTNRLRRNANHSFTASVAAVRAASALPPALGVAGVFHPHDPLEGPLGPIVLGLLVWVGCRHQRLGQVQKAKPTSIRTWTRTGRCRARRPTASRVLAHRRAAPRARHASCVSVIML